MIHLHGIPVAWVNFKNKGTGIRVNRTRMLLVLGSLLAIFVAPALAIDLNGGQAGSPQDSCKTEGNGRSLSSSLGLSAQQIGKLQELRNRHLDETATMRNELIQKKLEIRRLFSDPSVNNTTLADKHKEIESYQQRLFEKTTQFRLGQSRVLTPKQLMQLNDAVAGPSGTGCP